MHESALHLPRSDWWPRLPVAIRAAARPDVLVFYGATAVVALRALVVAFVGPESGTGARDHLLRGLVSLDLLALAALAYPRWRAGARAALAAFLGVLAVEGAGLAIADARAVGARGEELQPHYYEALRQPKPIWMIPEAGHTGGLIARPGEYERRVVGFFERTLEDEDTS